ncbi:MAG: DUF4179 domain-containing protein [Clostridia bacterium]|nr:DUF4179 domain-containing protein [Clostridia bacterium]
MNNNEFRQAVDLIDDSLLADISPTSKRRASGLLLKMIPAAAILFFALSIAGFATGVIPLPPYLSKLIGIDGGEKYTILGETQTANGYSVTFEGIVKGEDGSGTPFRYNQGTEEAFEIQPEDSLTAVFTISRTDGKSMEDGELADFDALLLVDGYVSRTFYPQLPFGGELTQDGTLHLAVLINPYELLADRGLHIALVKRPVYIDTVLRADRETGEFYFVEDYDGIRAIFEIPLDISYADAEKGEKLLKATAWALEPLESAPEDWFEH